MDRKYSIHNRIIFSTVLAGLYVIMRIAVRRNNELDETDKENPYTEYGRKNQNKDFSNKDQRLGFYGSILKKMIDRFLSFCALVILAPLFMIISIIIFIDDPGPVFFTQLRVGKDRHFFLLHKFRSMKMSTPHDVPTHQLKNPEQYITRVGRVLRKTSLDELPQLWDIFRGKMSIIGPRPALWNQDDLVKEREKYSANSIMPGLTGLAQIHGRDELEISEKAKLDGIYVKNLCAGGWKAVLQDIKCFFGTMKSVLQSDGVVEGGTGELYAKMCSVSECGFNDYGYLKNFDIDKESEYRVLITGANSYIGENFKTYAAGRYSHIIIDTLDMMGDGWHDYDFTGYHTVFHVAGIAHADVGYVDEDTKAKYYAVNTDLAIEAAKKARESGVSQFIFISSMIIYGDSNSYGMEQVIDEHTIPAPANFYGDSKWQADKAIRKLANDSFHVAILRLPMVYGKDSKGNYPALSKLAKTLPLFPAMRNKRSMLHIDNLCEFVSLLILSGEGGIYFPQNGEYSNTSELVQEIAKVSGKKIYCTKLLNPMVGIALHIPGKIGGMAKKAFGSVVYSQKLSVYKGMNYQVRTWKESVVCTEGKADLADGEVKKNKGKKRPVLILVNHDVVIYNFRLELVERLLSDGYEVHISSPYGERIDDLISLGAKYHEINIDRHGMNPMADISILKEYGKLISAIHPFIVLSYTIKPNIYGAMASRCRKIPFVANITGLGVAVENGGLKQLLAVLLYRLSFQDIQRVFFQNKENEEFFIRKHIAIGKHKLLPGSGVNLQRYPFTPYPECGDGRTGAPIKFAFISRIMKEKGIEQYLAAAEVIKKDYPVTEFHICGFCEAEYEGRMTELHKKGIVIYHGMIRDVAGFMEGVHCVVHPTYYPEGMSNVLLEASSSGRPIITTDRSGCREVVLDGVNGYMVSEKNEGELIAAIRKFIELPASEKSVMGAKAREYVKKNYDRDIVVSAYMEEIHAAESRL